MSYWSEIRNDYSESGDSIRPCEGDVLARITIDGWRSNEEQGSVIAEVLLSKRGDILVSYRDWIAATDDMAQKAIDEAKDDLKLYFEECGGCEFDQDLQNLDGAVQILVRDCNGKRKELLCWNNAAVLHWAEEEMSEDDEILLITQGNICVYSGLQADPKLTLTRDDITGFFA